MTFVHIKTYNAQNKLRLHYTLNNKKRETFKEGDTYTVGTNQKNAHKQFKARSRQ